MSRKGSSGSAIVVLVFAAFLAGVTYRYWRSDEREIRRHLSNLGEVLSPSAPENEAARFTRFAAIREYLSPAIQVRFDDQVIASRDELLERLWGWVAPSGGVAVEFVDIAVSLSPDATAAGVDLVAKLSTSGAPSPASRLQTRRVQMTLVKLRRDWVISSVEADRAK